MSSGGRKHRGCPMSNELPTVLECLIRDKVMAVKPNLARVDAGEKKATKQEAGHRG
jgi:hypothetical protein